MFKSLVLVLALVSYASAARQINAEGIKLIKSFEGFRANFYKDAVGIKTIGYGHACHTAASHCEKIHPPISEHTGEVILRNDLTSYENCVETNTPHLDDDKFAALVSFVFNLGCGNLQNSALKNYIHAKNYHAAAGEFGKYVHAGGKVLQGLVRRRATERALFCRTGGC